MSTFGIGLAIFGFTVLTKVWELEYEAKKKEFESQ